MLKNTKGKVIVPYPGTFVKKSWQKNFSRKKVKRNLHMTPKVLRSSRYTMIVYLPQWEIWVKFCLQRWAINNFSPTLKSWSPNWESSSPVTNSSSPTFPILNGGGRGEGGSFWKNSVCFKMFQSKVKTDISLRVLNYISK